MKNLRQSQGGIALLLFLFIAFGIASFIVLSVLNNSSGRQEQQRKTELALLHAKEALIGDAVANLSIPGRLRCPELLSVLSPTEGQAQSNCATNATRIGRFPWKTLGTERLTDGTGEPLWYVLSSGFSTPPINSNSTAQLQLDGVPNAAVALIIAPGSPLAGQSRSPASPTNPPQIADYLDLGNAGGSAFITAGPDSSFNDRIIVVTHADLFKAVNMRVLGEIRGLDDLAPYFPNTGLRNYHQLNGQFPWADSDGDGLANLNILTGKLPYKDLVLDAWIFNNNWPSLIAYTRISANSAQISIGTSTLKVVPCTTLPCP